MQCVVYRADAASSRSEPACASGQSLENARSSRCLTGSRAKDIGGNTMNKSRFVWSAIAAGVLAFTPAATAQQVNPKLVITGKEAEDVGEMNMINAATAEAISHACEKMAAEHGQNAAVVIT